MQRFGLRDDQWERIKDFLPGREGHVGGNAADNRLFIEAILYRYRTGIPWRDLPARFGDWKIVYQRFSRWAKSGVFERIFKLLASDHDNEYMMITRYPEIAGLDVAALDRRPGDHVRAPFAILFAGMGGVGVVERLAIDGLRVLGQMVADGGRQVAVHAIRHSKRSRPPPGCCTRKANANRQRPALR